MKLFGTYLALLLLLALTVGAAFVNLGSFNLLVALSISVLKALLVILVFMEVAESEGLIKLFAAAGFFWLVIMFTLSATDYLTRL